MTTKGGSFWWREGGHSGWRLTTAANGPPGRLGSLRGSPRQQDADKGSDKLRVIMPFRVRAVLATCDWLPLTSRPTTGALPETPTPTYANDPAFNQPSMVACFADMLPKLLAGRATIMKTITSVLAVLVFVSCFVWISALAIAADADRRVPAWYRSHDASPAWH